MKETVKTFFSPSIFFLFLFLISACESEELTPVNKSDLATSTGIEKSLSSIAALKKAGTTRLLRYRHYAYKDNVILTTIPRVEGAGGFESLSDLGYIYPSKTIGAVPLYEYYNHLHQGDERRFYSTKYLATENGRYFEIDGFLYYYEGIIGYVPKKTAVTRPVYRYSWSTPFDIHPVYVYSFNGAAPVPGFEGVYFYVW